MEDKNHKIIPAFCIVGNNIPEVHYRITKKVYEEGKAIRTQYDRKDAQGNFIDPPSKDAKVLALITNPFNQPRFPVTSYCEIGKYIAEIMGVKDHLVIPFAELKKGLDEGNLSTIWPYTYSQRLSAYPLQNGKTFNQMEMLLERVAQSPITRRAVAMTGVPEIDDKLKEDMPCLREVQFRCTEEDDGLYLHMDTKWRSHDGFKGWPDNLPGLTFMQADFARRLNKMMNREVKVGSCSIYSSSWHLYGQDITEKGVAQYVQRGEQNAVERAMTSEQATEALIIPHLEELISEKEVWNFSNEKITYLNNMIEDLRTGKIIA
jgi:thymidylate synthase